MIKSKIDYYRYLEADRIANGYSKKRVIFKNDIWKFLCSLRRLEYAQNCWHGIKRKVMYPFLKLIWRHYSVKTGLTIYPNSFKEGLTIYHYGCIVVNGSVRAGKNITLQCGVNIAENVKIGNDCYISPGVKIAKNVSIPENCVIGYNAVVTKSLPYANSTYAGVPARLLSHNGYVKDGIRRKL